MRIFLLLSCPAAVDRLERSLEALPYTSEQGEGEIIRLTMFSHDSPGLKALRHKIAVSLVSLLENDPAALEQLHKLHLKQRRARK